MLTPIIVEIVLGIISDSLIQELVISSAKKNKLAIKIQEIILGEFENALQGLPFYDDLLSDLKLHLFFEDVTIQREITTLVSPNESPNIDVLFRKWGEYYPSFTDAQIKRALTNFITNATEELVKIPELTALLAYKRNRDDNASILATVKGLEKNIVKRGIGFDSASDISGDRQTKEKYQHVIENCNYLIKNNRPYAALDLLRDAEENWADYNLSNRDKAKILNLIGNCYLVTTNHDEAKNYYQRAITLDPENYKYLANNALVELHLGEYQEAKILALQSQTIGENEIALSVLTEVEAWEKNYQELESIVKTEHLNNSLYLFTLGSIFYKAREYEKAIGYLEKYLAAQPNDFSANLFIGQIILENAVPDKWTHAYELSIKGNDWKAPIEKVVKYSQKALDILSKGDNETQKIEAQASIAAALLIQGRLDKATEFFDEILRSQPNHRMALHNRITVSIFKGDFRDALELMQRLPDDYLLKPNFYATASRAYIGANQPQKTIELLESLSGNEFDEPNYYVMLAWANHELNNIEGFDGVKEKLFSKSDLSESNKHETFASMLSIIGEKENAINELKSSLTLAVDLNEQRRLKLRIADQFFNLQEFDQAVHWFEESECDLLVDPFIARNYIYSLFKIDEFRKAYQECKKLSELDVFDPVILDIQGRIAEYLTDFPTAIKVEEKFIEKEIDRDFHQAQLARLYFRDRNKVKSLEALNKVEFKNIESAFLTTQCSQLYLLLDKPQKAIQLALKAFIQDQGSAEVNLSYIGTFLRVDSLIELDTGIVENNTAILIHNGQKQEWWKLVDVYEPNIRLNEYSPTYEVARKLMGHTKGDNIIIKDTEFEKLEVEIIEIQSIYVRIFQDIADNFSSRFPSNRSFNKVKISRDDPSEFFMAVAKMGLHLEQVLNFYNSQLLSIEQLAFLAGKTPLDTLLLLQSDPLYKVFASKGSMLDFQREFENFAKTKSITFTFTGIALAATLGLLEYFPKVFDNLYVSQDLVEEFEKELEQEKFLGERGRGRVGYYGGKFSFFDIPKDVIDNKINFLTKVLVFLDNECERVPISKENSHLLSKPDSPEDFKNSPGRLTQTSMIIAKQTGSLLYSDETIIRKTAKNFGIASFWTQSLLRYLVSLSVISEIQYSQLVSTLILLNYFTPTLSEKIIFPQIRHGRFQCSNEVRNLLSGLSGEDINDDYAIEIGSNLIKRIWLEAIPQENRFFLQEAILSALLDGRKNKDLIVYKLIDSLNSKLDFSPQVKEVVKVNLLKFARLAY